MICRFRELNSERSQVQMLKWLSMKRFLPLCIALFAGHGALAAPRLPLVGTIAMNGVEGRFDHFAYDPTTKRLFVSGLENRTVEVVDIAKRRRIGRIVGVFEPQGLLVVPQSHRLIVASRGDGTVRSFDTRTLRQGPWLDVGRNADNVRFDAASQTVIVGSNGEPGAGKLSAIALAALIPRAQGGEVSEPRSPADLFPLYAPNAPRQASPKFELDLPSHPESMQLDPARGQMFVNVPDEHTIAQVKVDKGSFQVEKKFPVPYKKNFPMAFDAPSHRLFVVCRIPARLLIYNTLSGQKTADVPCVGDADEVYFDAKAQRVLVVGGQGALDVFRLRSGALALESHTPTAPRARTGAYLPALGLLVVAAPHTLGHPAKLLMYRARF